MGVQAIDVYNMVQTCTRMHEQFQKYFLSFNVSKASSKVAILFNKIHFIILSVKNIFGRTHYPMMAWNLSYTLLTFFI